MQSQNSIHPLTQTNHVDVLQLRALLHDLLAHRPDIMIRLRLLGLLWQPSFLRIRKVTEQGAILTEAGHDKPIIISNLNFVVQFEIDTAFKQFQPNNHYSIKNTLL